MQDKKELVEEARNKKAKGRGSASSNYMNLYVNQSGRNSDNKNYPMHSSGAKYDKLKPK